MTTAPLSEAAGAAAGTGAALAEAKIVTFGCRLNAYESEVMREHARAQGLTNAVILNSCAVTAEAERQFRQAVRRARREHPDAEIVVTGCAVQLAPERYAAMAEVDRVLGNLEKLEAASFAGTAPRRAVGDIMAARDLAEETAGHLIAGFAERTRAFVQVQQGCDHRCTFCIIPFGRGPSRSLPLGEIVRQVRLLVEGGVREVVLTGVDLTDYGKDLPGRPGLGQAARRLLALVPELPRLRLSSVDPVELDEDLFRLLAEEPRLMPHLHLSIQAGDDLVLKRMKRRHLRADVLRTVERARAARPDVVFGADLIAGFPTESEAAFENTLALVEEADLTWLHVFPYSEREGTPAARMPAVAKPLRKERAARLRAAGEAAAGRFLAGQLGRPLSVLVEEPGRGHSAQFAPVSIPGSEGGRVGEIVEVVASRIAEGALQADAGARTAA
ncbi:threonylcarbamoyladenosine tRNA methylthiotransferase MtaB [Tistlia consotensis]|uniref:Threonylcarbamoyladenosine tRNA methylthiotransferase MtaB n=1 Tax=Tistlia consotensis USBA 355 TaxID=560819 RepID=A0A1Y6CU44_9PROT|nr:threonylcarbamoyladenosine tRNA methylthiotransferase MtaB [Tistlia consotensis USBA 355]SNS11324.1 threonylcarbamoyladenosine tRNA methylthiotransferase MtaB [Tistlia consotensis]